MAGVLALGAKGELPVLQEAAAAGGQLTRREVVRRLLAGMGASAAWPVVSAAHPFYEHLENGTAFDIQDQLVIIDWKPVFLNQFEDRRLVVLAERIVPGSEKAQVNRFIDLLLSVDNEKHQKDFVGALAAFETESSKRFGRHLTALNGAQLDEILTDASVNRVGGQATSGEGEESGLHERFENLKGWVGGAYYSSEIGMRELGWTEDRVFASFPGCEHPEGHH
jgi:hypothetical protein